MIWNKILEFEKKYNLFDLQDFQGTYYWDILRGEIYYKFLYKNSIKIYKRKKRNYLLYIKIIFDFLRLYFFSYNKKYLFYIMSRYKDNNGLFFDQATANVYSSFNDSEKLVIETYLFNKKESFFNPVILYRKLFFFFKKNQIKNNLSFLIDLLKREFGELNFDENFLNDILIRYYADLSFYKKILKLSNIEKVFFVHNGIQKGLIMAAKELNIMTYECQHGLVNIAHLIYSYPEINFKKNQVILPDYILSFSSFWFKDLNLPGVKICPIGNNYYYKPTMTKSNLNEVIEGSIITVISSDIYGVLLSDFLLKGIDNLSHVTIYFKLHPNQYDEKDIYEKKFYRFSNIKVITVEKSVDELLEKSDTIFAIVSTIVYEAIQKNKKVIILKKENYMSMEHIFYFSNVHLVDTFDEFVSKLKMRNDNHQNITFFEPFNKEYFLKILDK